MKKIIIEHNNKNNEYLIPENWNDITVKKFSEVNKISQEITGIQQKIELVSILCNIEKNIIYKMYSDQLDEIFNQISFFLNTDELLINDKNSIIINDEEYFFYNDIEKFTVAEEINITNISEYYNNDITKAFGEFLCIFLRKKINGKFEEFDESFMERVDMFNNLSIKDVFSHIVFFSQKRNK